VLTCVLFPLVLAGCGALGGGQGVAPRLYDFGVAAKAVSPPEVPVALGTVTAAPAVAGTEIRYRWANDPLRTLAYTESRWLTPPSELLANRFAEVLGGSRATGTRVGRDPEAGPRPLRLAVEITTFEQVFDSPTSARALLRIVAEVQYGRSRRVLARRVVEEELATPSADAAGAVTALVQLADRAVVEVLRWLADDIEVPAEPVEVVPESEGRREPGAPAAG
jgi:cholesterol transport system auxiliary component